jgi:hypothetical protein
VSIANLVWRQDARHRLALGLPAGVAVFLTCHRSLQLWSAGIAGWNAFAAVILALDWLTIWTTPQRKIRERAQQEDLSRLLIFIFLWSPRPAPHCLPLDFSSARTKIETAGISPFTCCSRSRP